MTPKSVPHVHTPNSQQEIPSQIVKGKSEQTMGQGKLRKALLNHSETQTYSFGVVWPDPIFQLLENEFKHAELTHGNRDWGGIDIGAKP